MGECDNKSEAVEETLHLKNIRTLFSEKKYKEAIDLGEPTLPKCTNPRLISELHLLLAKCYRGIGDLKTCISSCNSAIEQYSLWKEPFLYRSACYQALHTSFTETDGDTIENIERDRQRADIVVDPNREPTEDKVEEEDPEKERLKRNRLLFRPAEREKKEQIVVNQISDALRKAKDGDIILVEKGVYTVSPGASKDLSSYFILGKNITLIGASTKDCILLYKREDEERESDKVLGQLETFLICASLSESPTLIKRLTFRNNNSCLVKTKFFGVAGGRVQFEDCIFDGVENSEVDGVYTNSKICGSLANNYPKPNVSLRFCIFDHCRGFGALTFIHSVASVRCCYFNGCGRTAVAAMDFAKVKVENCEFSQSEETETTISSTGSDITVTGNYVQGLQIGMVGGKVTSQAVGVLHKSVGKVEKNYLYKTGSGLSSVNSDIIFSKNLVYNCSRRYNENFGCQENGSQGKENSSLGLHSGISLRGKTKAQIVENITKFCDVGIHVSEEAMPAVKDNVLDSSFFAGIFAENGARPNVMGNTISGGELHSNFPRGLGVLFIGGAGGLVGKNKFEDFEVSPVLIFSNCHPMLKQNSYVNVNINEHKQAELEAGLLNQFQSEVEEDSNLYLVDSDNKESTLAEVIFKGIQT